MSTFFPDDNRHEKGYAPYEPPPLLDYRIDDCVPATGHCCDDRGWDPCEPSTAVTDYYGTERTPRDAADDREWLLCPCDQYTVRGTPDEDCAVCLGYGVVIATSHEIAILPCPGEHPGNEQCALCHDTEYYATTHISKRHDHCESCSGGDETASCTACYGSGYRFTSCADFDEIAVAARAREQRLAEEIMYAYYEQIAEQLLQVPPAELPPDGAGRFQLRVIQLESEERRACGHCVDGWAKIDHMSRRCTTCKGRGHVPLVVDKWLCDVDTVTAYYEHRDGRVASGPIDPNAEILPGWTLRYGRHYPEHLPIERRIPFHKNDAVTHAVARPHTVQGKPSAIPARSWRTTTGVEHPIERITPDGLTETYRNTYSLRTSRHR